MRTSLLFFLFAAALAAPPSAGRLAGQEAVRRGRPDPILFVHGWRGDAAQWRRMMARFREDGWTDRELFAWNFDPAASNATIARQVSARIDQILAATGARKVDVVTHSMGSLSTRHYLRRGPSAGKVDAWVSLGGPNHGTHTAELCFSAACREMRPGSAFLAALNAGDETPGEVRFGTWWSPCDEIIEPVRSVLLEGAANHRTRCIGHLDLLRDLDVYEQVRDFVQPLVVVGTSPAPHTPQRH